MDSRGGAITADPQQIKDYYDSYDVNSSGYSGDALAFLLELKQKQEEYNSKGITLDDFSNYCDQKQAQIALLGDPVEAKAIGVVFSVAKHSEQYWAANTQAFIDKFGANGCSEGITHCGTTARRVPWGGIAYADVSGAINGGRIGAVAAGGIPGAVAGGLMGAGISSGLRVLSFAIFGD
jgi:hypothetical protein